jgi:hypothetical protein
LFKPSLHIGLLADRVVLVRQSPLLGRSELRQTSMALPADEDVSTGAAALDALQELLKDPSWHGAQAYVQLSGTLVSYAIVPSSGQPLSAAEELALAQLKLRQVHGAGTGERQIRLGNLLQGQDQIAAALESDFVQRLQKILKGADLRLCALQPMLMQAFNRVRGQLRGRDFWFALAEPGLLTLARWQDGHWRSLDASATDEPLAQALAARLREARLMSSSATDTQRVYLCAPGLDSSACAAAPGLDLVRLPDARRSDPIATALRAMPALGH